MSWDPNIKVFMVKSSSFDAEKKPPCFTRLLLRPSRLQLGPGIFLWCSPWESWDLTHQHRRVSMKIWQSWIFYDILCLWFLWYVQHILTTRYLRKDTNIQASLKNGLNRAGYAAPDHPVGGSSTNWSPDSFNLVAELCASLAFGKTPVKKSRWWATGTS